MVGSPRERTDCRSRRGRCCSDCDPPHETRSDHDRHDLGAAESSLLSNGVAGFYDPTSKTLVVRGEKPTPYVRQVLVHELTHALQDQYFSINRPDLDRADDERGDGLLGLSEGDAVRVD